MRTPISVQGKTIRRARGFAARLATLLIAGVAGFAGWAADVSAPPVATPSVRITNGEWPPYLSPSLPHHGVASRIVSEAFALQDIRVEYGFFPWNRAFQLAKSGRWHGTAVWLSSPEREADFFLSDPVVEARYVFFHRRDLAFDWEDIDDLAGLRIGATQEYHYGDAFDAAERDGRITVDRVSSDEQNFSRLLAGRIQVFPMDHAVGLTLLRKHFSAQDRARITLHPRPLRVDALRLLLSRQRPENAAYMDRFNRGLKELRERGKITQYLDEIRQETDKKP